MDFGAVGVEGFVGSDNTICGFGSDRGTKYGSGLLKQERSDAIDDDWRSSKLSKATESMLLPLKSNSYSSSSSLFPFAQQQQQMLSFSCPKSEAEKIPQNLTLPGFHLINQAYSRTAGCSYEALNAGNLHGVFTAPQWMELQHQALIYKYITANVPIPSNLLNPIKRALDSSTFSAYSGGLLRPNTLSWGGFHLGFSSNADPEPGRCRRTDGKKWRCSRDAVADQKYCERHMNRGRHRSRKHVEGQSGHSAAAAKPVPASAAAGLLGSGASGVAHAQQQLKNLQSDNSSNLSGATSINRMFLSKETSGERMQDSSGLPTPSNANLKSSENPFLFPKQQSPFQESPQPDFGQVNSDSLLNPCKKFGSSDDLTEHQNIPQNSIRQFMDNWPTSQSDQTSSLWPQLDGQTDRTQLSISIPAAPTDFMSSTSSPNNEKPGLSPSRVSCDLDLNAFNQRQANWSPVPWETSVGGPLGEVLHSGNNSGSECKSSYSPTGVLQKPTFGSLSNSSAGSSPRADLHRASDGASLCCEFLAPV